MGAGKETESANGSMTPNNDDGARRKHVRDEWATDLRGTKEIWGGEQDASMEESRCRIGKGEAGIEEIRKEIEEGKVQGGPRKSYGRQPVRQFEEGEEKTRTLRRRMTLAFRRLTIASP